jgi:hypothetical protein
LHPYKSVKVCLNPGWHTVTLWQRIVRLMSINQAGTDFQASIKKRSQPRPRFGQAALGGAARNLSSGDARREDRLQALGLVAGGFSQGLLET